MKPPTTTQNRTSLAAGRVWLHAAIYASLLLFTPLAFAAETIPAFTAKYGIEKYGVKLAEATYQLSHTEEGYRFSQQTELTGLASMFRDDSISAVSQVRNNHGQLLLLSHRYTQTGEEKNRDEDFTIDWHDTDSKPVGRIRGTVRGKPVDLTTDKPVWEALSFQLPLMLDAKEGRKRYPYYALLKGELDTYFFELAAVESIRFAGDDYRTLKLIRKNPEKKRELRIWLMPELSNIPVAVENMREGKQHSYMRLESITIDGQPTITDNSYSASSIDDEF